MSSIPDFWAVIPAGGSGTRLWPLSRAGHPKFLHDLTGEGHTLIQGTVDRVAPLAADRVVVVTGVAHAEAVRAQLPGLTPDRVLAEPSPRDSMAAIAWAAAVIEREDPEAMIGSFAADHVIPDAEAFRACVAEAVAVAREDYVVTIGVEPTFPATSFGYIQMGHALDGHATAARVRQFVEKPDASRAANYLATGEFRWNAGMFVVKATVLLDLLTRWHPELAAGVRAIAADPSTLAQRWPELTRIAIDHAIAEPAADIGRVAVVPGAFTWNDVGDFATPARAAADRGRRCRRPRRSRSRDDDRRQRVRRPTRRSTSRRPRSHRRRRRGHRRCRARDDGRAGPGCQGGRRRVDGGHRPTSPDPVGVVSTCRGCSPGQTHRLRRSGSGQVAPSVCRETGSREHHRDRGEDETLAQSQ